jgi:hypothetical protein
VNAAAFLTTPLLPALVAACGVGLARMYYAGLGIMAALLAAIILLLCYGAVAAGKGSLPADPVAAVRLMSVWSIAQALLATAAAAAVIIVTIEGSTLGAQESASADALVSKELAASLTSAVTAFIAGAVVGVGKGADEELGERIKHEFHNAYGRAPVDGDTNPDVHYFNPGSRGEQLVYSDLPVTGWGRAARKERARRLKEELAAGTSDA